MALLDRFRLDQKVAIVTGASRGLGEGIALALAEAGADVVCAARTPEAIETVATKIRAFGRRALVVPCDVMQREQIENLAERAFHEFGHVDIVVNNAGGGPYKPALRTSVSDFEDTLRFNLTSTFLLTRLIVPRMLEAGGGSILNISSALGHLCERGFVAYGTAKAGLAHMTKLLAFEFAPKVRVNALAVGSVETPALAPFLADAKMRNKMVQATPLKRIGTPEDIALAALYLSSPAASWVTGKVFEIDGGALDSNFPLKMEDL